MFSVPRNLGSRPEPVLQIEIQATTPNQPKPGFQSNPLIQTKQDMSKGLLDTCAPIRRPRNDARDAGGRGGDAWDGSGLELRPAVGPQ